MLLWNLCLKHVGLSGLVGIEYGLVGLVGLSGLVTVVVFKRNKLLSRTGP